MNWQIVLSEEVDGIITYNVAESVIDRLNDILDSLKDKDVNFFYVNDESLFDSLLSRIVSSQVVKDKLLDKKELEFLTVKCILPTREVLITVGQLSLDENRYYINGVLY